MGNVSSGVAPSTGPRSSIGLRKAVVLHDKDTIEQHLNGFRTESFQRLAVQKVRKRGILLPFGCDDTGCTVSSP
jgi:hypothetical protein